MKKILGVVSKLVSRTQAASVLCSHDTSLVLRPMRADTACIAVLYSFQFMSQLFCLPKAPASIATGLASMDFHLVLIITEEG